MESILNVLSYWDSALAITLVLGGLIFFHELGHFLANRAMGIGVITFSIGMGPKLWSFKKDKTEYRLSWLPFGGYVAAVGEYSDEVEELGFTKEEAVYNRPPWQRMILAFAGPFANILLAWIIYVGLSFSTGLAIPLPQIGNILPDSPAISAGLEKGDTVLAIDGTALNQWQQIPEIVNASNGKTLDFEISRNDETLNLALTPKEMTRTNLFGEEEIAWLIGVQPFGSVRHEALTFSQSIKQGFDQTWTMITLTLTGLKKLVTGSVSADAVGGPILIGQMIGEQAKVGLTSLLLLAALISVNLGLLNLLPIPVLDGGMIVFCLIEMIIRRPVPEFIQEKSMQVGAFLLISLMVFATFNDIMRWFE